MSFSCAIRSIYRPLQSFGTWHASHPSNHSNGRAMAAPLCTRAGWVQLVDFTILFRRFFVFFFATTTRKYEPVRYNPKRSHSRVQSCRYAEVRAYIFSPPESPRLRSCCVLQLPLVCHSGCLKPPLFFFCIANESVYILLSFCLSSLALLCVSVPAPHVPVRRRPHVRCSRRLSSILLLLLFPFWKQTAGLFLVNACVQKP